MSLLIQRWSEFETQDRTAMETRIRKGIPRSVFRPDAFDDNEEQWNSIRDSATFRRLKRLQASGVALSDESRATIGEIEAAHPEWRSNPGDRDDFHVWHSSWQGPIGHPEDLQDVPDENLVKEALRREREEHFEEADVWRLFCSSDPDRALRGLQLSIEQNQWDSEAWRQLVSAAAELERPEFQAKLAEALAAAPDEILSRIATTVTSWLQTNRARLSNPADIESSSFIALWDRFAAVVFPATDADKSSTHLHNELMTEWLNDPGGILADVLTHAQSELGPKQGAGLDGTLRPRFDHIIGAPGRTGLLGRVRLAFDLAFFDTIDPTWTEAALLPRFSWTNPESGAFWGAFSHSRRIGRSTLFNRLKPALLESFERRDLSDQEFKGLIGILLAVSVWHQEGSGLDYQLTFGEVRRALTLGPEVVREHVSSELWRKLANVDGGPEEKGACWCDVVGPIFRAIWPLDAALRTEAISRNLVLVAMESGTAFPTAVEDIYDLLVPYCTYGLSHTLRLERTDDDLVRTYSRAFLQLINAIVNPDIHPSPHDLPDFLDQCARADPTILEDSAYIRLHGLRRKLHA